MNCVWIANDSRNTFFVSDLSLLQTRNMRHMLANRQWTVVNECQSGNIFATNHWFSMHILRSVCLRTTRKLLKTPQYCVNLSCSNLGIALSTDPANIAGKLRRFLVRKKNDEIRTSQMHRARLKICARFMRLRDFWAVWPSAYVNLMILYFPMIHNVFQSHCKTLFCIRILTIYCCIPFQTPTADVTNQKRRHLLFLNTCIFVFVRNVRFILYHFPISSRLIQFSYFVRIRLDIFRTGVWIRHTSIYTIFQCFLNAVMNLISFKVLCLLMKWKTIMVIAFFMSECSVYFM
jgi:hypothetical protein